MQENNATGSKRCIKFDALSESTSGINKNRKVNEDYRYIDKERNRFNQSGYRGKRGFFT
jgi:hypothetical protein